MKLNEYENIKNYITKQNAYSRGDHFQFGSVFVKKK
jgi:hypothetical protein